MKAVYSKGGKVAYKCPGCQAVHYIPVVGPKKWEFNFDLDKPTLSPSILESYGAEMNAELPESHRHQCHHFLRDGQIQFLGDCLHDKKNQTLEVPDVPAEWLTEKFQGFGFTLERPVEPTDG